MRVLHIHFGQAGQSPRAMAIRDAQRSCPSGAQEVIVVDLSVEGVDYDSLVDEVFRADKVLSWPQ